MDFMRREGEKYIVVKRILNFEGLDVTTLLMDSKVLKQVAGQINQGFMNFGWCIGYLYFANGWNLVTHLILGIFVYEVLHGLNSFH